MAGSYGSATGTSRSACPSYSNGHYLLSGMTLVTHYAKSLSILILFLCSTSLFKKQFLKIPIIKVISEHYRNFGGEKIKIEKETFPMLSEFRNHQR